MCLRRARSAFVPTLSYYSGFSETIFFAKRLWIASDFGQNGNCILSLLLSHTTDQHRPTLRAASWSPGECYLTYEHGQYTSWPSEGGHCEFAPRTQLEIELLQFLKSKFNEDFRVSVERIVSNRGLANVYEFLSHHPEYGPTVTPEGMCDAPGICSSKSYVLFTCLGKGIRHQV